MTIIFEQTNPMYFTENLNCEEKREFPIKIWIDNKEIFTGAVFDGEDYNLVCENKEHSLEETMEYVLKIDDFWEMNGCDQIHDTYKDFVNSVYQHAKAILNGKAKWNNFIKLSENMKQGYISTEKGQRIENIPHTGTLTGRYKIDFYGCWWEVSGDDGVIYWMIGEYPQRERINHDT